MDYSREPAAISPDRVETKFLTRVYAWMAGGLVTTSLVAWLTLSTPALLSFVLGNRLVFFGLMLGELALVAWLSGLVGRMSASTAAFVFLAYSALNGLTLSTIFLVYTSSSIASTFVIAGGTFAAMSVYGLVTSRPLDGLGSFAFMGLIGVLIASLVNIFLKSPMMEFVIGCVGVIVFVGLTAYDTRKLKIMAASVDADSEAGQKGAIQGALALYLDFINLFLMLLRLFGNRR
ncbi:MAG: Bax inhibitor-1/YccA family protein [Holophagales bacterium]|nr:Bax inhibitor-1/YccA family protein [Holophagales bacterium]MBK9965045.1 Bax inhibitor-1/YccA family protein [Holophagales bacterium]